MKLSSFLRLSSKTTNPQANPSIVYNLYSLPSFDDGRKCEVVHGSEIQSNKFIVPDKCILFNKLNVRFKRIWRIDNTEPNKIASTEFLPLVVDESIVDFHYCYYLLRSDRITDYLTGQNTNTSGSHKRIDPDNFFDIEVSLPPLEDQKRIGEVLSNLDMKIDINTSLNHYLEAMAKQLYDYWFVQFDYPDAEGKPYKSSGGKMVWNEKLKREIPEGWDVVSVGDILDGYPTTKKYETKEYQPSGLYPIIDQGGQYIVGYTNEDSNLLNRLPAVLFGDHSTKVKLLDFPFARGADGTQILYSNTDRIQQYYLYHAVLSMQIPNPGYSRHFKYLKEMPIIKPDLDIAQKFDKTVTPIYKKWTALIHEINDLSKQRDELLPLLMTGQVSVTPLNNDL